jgi:hypothetical protein
LKRREIGKRKGKKNKAEKLRRPGRPSFLLALLPRRCHGDALKTLHIVEIVRRKSNNSEDCHSGAQL